MQFWRLVEQLYEATASVSDPEQALRKHGHVVGKVTWTWILWGWAATHASLPLPPHPQLQRWVICRIECLSYGANMPLAQVSGKLKEGVGGTAGPAAAPHWVCCHLATVGEVQQHLYFVLTLWKNNVPAASPPGSRSLAKCLCGPLNLEICREGNSGKQLQFSYVDTIQVHHFCVWAFLSSVMLQWLVYSCNKPHFINWCSL